MKSSTWAAALAALMFAIPAAAKQPGDAWITTKTKIALLADTDVDGTRLNVDTSGGVVTLHGTLPDQAQRDRAVALAKGIEGVTSVRDYITVSIEPEGYRAKPAGIADDRLRTDVAKALDTTMLTGSSIKVEAVDKGTVTLSGKADSLADQRLALFRARTVPGVRHVNNRIDVTDTDDADAWRMRTMKEGKVASRAGDAYITSAVKLRLLADEETPGLAINVDTNDGVVTLFGVVPTAAAKTRAESEAKQVEDVAGVVNALQVVPEERQASVAKKDDEIKTAVNDAIDKDARLDDAHVDVEVKNGVVRLTGHVATAEDRIVAAQRARAVAGVRAVRQELEVKASMTASKD